MTFGGPNVTSIICEGDEVKPFTVGTKEGCYHYFSDASINVTGGIGMFAGTCLFVRAEDELRAVRRERLVIA